MSRKTGSRRGRRDGAAARAWGLLLLVCLTAGCGQADRAPGDAAARSSGADAAEWLEITSPAWGFRLVLLSEGAARVDLVDFGRDMSDGPRARMTLIAPTCAREVRRLIRVTEALGVDGEPEAGPGSDRFRWLTGGRVTDVRARAAGLLAPGLRRGVLEEAALCGLRDVARALAARAEAESLHRTGDLAGATRKYQEAMDHFFCWAKPRVWRADQRLIYEPELALADAAHEAQHGRLENAFAEYRAAWEAHADQTLILRREGPHLVLGFRSGALAARGLPETLNEEAIRRLRQWEFPE